MSHSYQLDYHYAQALESLGYLLLYSRAVYRLEGSLHPYPVGSSEFSEAETLYRRAIRADPGHVLSRHGLAAFLFAGKHDHAAAQARALPITVCIVHADTKR